MFPAWTIMTELQKENLEGNYKAWSPTRKEKEEKKEKFALTQFFIIEKSGAVLGFRSFSFGSCPRSPGNGG
jgi:hypothetical protein